MKQRTILLSDEHSDQLKRLGGAKWVRQQIDLASVSSAGESIVADLHGKLDRYADIDRRLRDVEQRRHTISGTASATEIDNVHTRVDELGKDVDSIKGYITRGGPLASSLEAKNIAIAELHVMVEAMTKRIESLERPNEI